jgi:hypothetical protein
LLLLQGKRYSLPNSRIMIHQPLGGAQGQATDIEIQANEILHHKLTLNGYLVRGVMAEPDITQHLVQHEAQLLSSAVAPAEHEHVSMRRLHIRAMKQFEMNKSMLQMKATSYLKAKLCVGNLLACMPCAAFLYLLISHVYMVLRLLSLCRLSSLASPWRPSLATQTGTSSCHPRRPLSTAWWMPSSLSRRCCQHATWQLWLRT